MRFWAVVACLMGLASLAGCDRVANAAKPPIAKTSVTLMHYFTATSVPVIEKQAKVFSQKSTDYELKVIALHRAAFKYRTLDIVQSDYPPDTFTYWAGARTTAAIPNLVPLDDIWQQTGLNEILAPRLQRALSYPDGHRYSIPFAQYNVAFFYNKKVFEKYGVKPPVTWQDFLAVCESFKAQGVVPVALGTKGNWPAQFWFDFLMLRTAGLDFREKLMAGQVRYDDPKVLQVFALWEDLIQRGYFSQNPNNLKWAGAADMVHRGEAAMTLMPSWLIGYFEDKQHRWVSGRDFDFFLFPVINPGVPYVDVGSVDALVLPKKAVNMVGAKSVLAYFASAEAQQAFSKVTGAFAPNSQVSKTVYSDLQLRLFKVHDQSSQFTFHFDLSTPPLVASLGTAALADFLAFPKAYPRILKELSRDAGEAFKQAERQ